MISLRMSIRLNSSWVYYSGAIGSLSSLEIIQKVPNLPFGLNFILQLFQLRFKHKQKLLMRTLLNLLNGQIVTGLNGLLIRRTHHFVQGVVCLTRESLALVLKYELGSVTDGFGILLA